MNGTAIAQPGRGELLAWVEQDLAESIALGARGQHPLLQAAARQLCLAPGAKRARPLLSLLFAEMTGAEPQAMAEVAVAIELIHSASLLHDDVVDEGALRRGRPTANATFGNAVAVLAGDHLLSSALLKLAPFPRELTTRAIEVVAEMSLAAVIEVEARGNVALPIATWREMAIGKTGALFGLCGFAAGLLAGKPAFGARLEEVGRRLGLAFQMQDDLDDLAAGDKEDRCGDLRERTPTFPQLLACLDLPEQQERIARLWEQPQITPEEAWAAGESLLATDVVERTLAAIGEELAVARAILRAAPRSIAAEEILAWASGLGRDPRGG